jgi:hypothetical protein
MSTIIDKSSLIAALDTLQTDATSWFGGTYKKSNDELFVLLGGCVDFCVQVKASRILRKQMNESLLERGIKCNENASLETRVVRWVFGACGDRAYTYACVIRSCVSKKISASDVPAYITANDGIDAIRRSSGTSSLDSANQQKLRDAARAYYITSNPLFTLPSALPALEPSETASHGFSVALLRQSDTGQHEIVFGTGNGTLVNSVLAAAGKSLPRQTSLGSAASDGAKLTDVIEAIIANGEVSE